MGRAFFIKRISRGFKRQAGNNTRVAGGIEGETGALQKLNEEVFKKTLYIDEVQTGIGWLILEYYRRKIRDRSHAAGTKRRKGYDSFFKRIKSKKIPGIPSVKLKPSPIIKHEQFVVPKLNENAMLMTGTKVSVIIPTRNAGSEFQHVLEKIRAQKGIGEIEVIVVDSGSEDDTLALAKRYQAKITQ